MPSAGWLFFFILLENLWPSMVRDINARFTPLRLLNWCHLLLQIGQQRRRFAGDYLPCLLMQSVKCIVQFHPQALFCGVMNSEHRRFHFISNYPGLQNIRLCHWRSRKTKNSSKDYSLGTLSFRPIHHLILSHGSGTRRLQVNQRCGWLFLGLIPFLLRQFEWESSQ